DLDRENLFRRDGHGRSLYWREREIHPVDEVGGRAVVGELAIGDLALPPLQLDQVARSVRPQLHPRHHAEYLLELHRPRASDVGGIEEVSHRRTATMLKADARQV